MSTEFITANLGDLIEFQRGFDLPQQKRATGNYPIVSSSGITDYHSESMVASPGVVTGRYGTIGKVFYLDQPFWPLNTTLWVKNFKGNHPKFVYYFLHTLDFNSCADKSRVPGVNRNDLHSISVKIPDIQNQQAIAEILSCLDNKIELNRQMNETLEAMAQALFKSWFVDFDPVKAKTEGQKPEGMDDAIAALFPSSFIESPLGLIPQGWRIGDIKDLCQRVESGGTPSRKESGYWDKGTIPWLTSGEVRQKVILDTEEKITERGLAESSAKVWPPMSTVVAMYGATAGQVTLLANSVSANQACCALVPKSYTQSFVFLKTAQSVEIYEKQARGSAQQNLNKSIVSELKTIVPPQKILEEFENVVSSLIVLIIQGFKENMILSELRDLLLPRLISGKLRVGEISETLEAVTS